MPLVIISGFPVCGKSTRTEELRNFFVANGHNVVVIQDDEDHEVYKETPTEKKLRGRHLSQVERSLDKNTIVIIDSLNYIKGYRYQLYCIARSLSTPHCVVHCGATVAHVKEWNKIRQDKGIPTYSDQLVDELISRYEEPDARNRWDSPLYTITPIDPDIGEFYGRQILEGFSQKKVVPRMSTVVKPITESNYVHEMERALQSVVDFIQETQRNGHMGGKVIVPSSSSSLILPSRTISLSEIRRLKRQFMQMNKMHTQIDTVKVASSFVDYLNTNL